MDQFNTIKKIYPSLLIFFIYVIASIWISYPLILHLGSFSTGTGDELLIAWIHRWVVHTIFTNPFDLFNANIYYPYQNSLAFSDLFITGSILTAPFVYLIGQPIAANNISVISSLFLLGFSTYLLTYYLTRNYFSSTLSGLLIIFSPATLSNIVQIQMLEVYWVPLAVLFFLLFLEKKKTKFIIFFFGCFLLQFYNSFLPAYFILFSSLIIFLFKWLDVKKEIVIYLKIKNLLLLLLTIILMIPLVIPYIHVSQEFHYTRDLRDSIHFALQPEDLLYPGAYTRLATVLLKDIPTNHYSQNNEFKPGYLGFVFSLLVLIVTVFTIKNRKKLTLYEKSFLTIALTGLLLSFGPFLHLNRQTIHHPFPIPLPYLLFYYIMPGFQGFRNSQRWEMLFILAIATLIGVVINRILKNISFKKKLVLYFLLFAGILFEFSPISFISITQVKNFPKIYSWMTTTSQNSSYIILPIYNWNMQPFVNQELYREYFSTVEFRPMVNGYSGFSPPPWQDFIYFMHKNFPSQQSIKKLRLLGIHYIIIDNTAFDTEHHANMHFPDSATIISELKNDKKVTFVKTLNNYEVYSIDEKK